MIRVALLGPVEIWTDAGAAALGKRERALVALLALNAGRVVPARVLVEQLWGQDPPETAANALQGYISRIRRVLGAEVVRTAGSGYALTVDENDVDVHVFERMAAEGHRALGQGRVEDASRLLRSALELWRGTPLAECSGLPFAEPEAMRLGEKRLLVLEDAFEADIARGDGRLILDDIAALCRQHPFRERLTGCWMKALYQAGRQTQALEVYAAHRTMLVEELGLEPAEQLQQIQQAILDADERLRPAPPPPDLPIRRPPVPVSPLLGRDQELVDLSALVLDPTTRLVTLLGPGGTGKTRLAVAVAHAVSDHFDAGACWVPLTGASTSGDVLPAIAHALGLANQTEAGIADAVAAQLVRRELLLVVDNVEHLLPDAALVVAHLLAAGSVAPILVTSRVAMRIHGEGRYPVKPLAVPDVDDDKAVEAVPACALFLDRVRRVRPNLALTDDTARAVRAICTRLEGLPLALELAAARSSLLSLTTIARRLEDRFTLLTSASVDAPPQQASLLATLDWSYGLLNDTQKTAFRRLSVNRGGLDLSDASTVVDHDGCLQGNTLELLQQLSDASLINVTEQSSGERVTMLDMIREYAAQRLHYDPAEEEATRRALVLYCIGSLPRGVPPYAATATEAARIADDQDNIRAALRYAREQDPEAMAQLAIGWSITLAFTDNPVEAEAWLAEAQASDAPSELRARADITRAIVLGTRGLLREALGILDSESSHDPQDKRWTITAAATRAWVLANTGQTLDVVTTIGERAVNDARQLNDPSLLGVVLSLVGPAVSISDVDRGRALLEEGARLSRQSNGLISMTVAINLAEIAFVEQDVESAQRWATAALGEPLAQLMPAVRIYLLDLLGASYLLQGETESAEAPLREALIIGDWIDDYAILGEVLPRFAVLAARAGDTSRARQLLREYAAAQHASTRTMSYSNRALLTRWLSHLPETTHILNGDVEQVAKSATRPDRGDLIQLALGEPLRDQTGRSDQSNHRTRAGQ